MTLIICNEETKEATKEFLTQRIAELDSEPLGEGEEEVCLDRRGSFFSSFFFLS